MERELIEEGSVLPGLEKLYAAPQSNLPIDQLILESKDYDRHIDYLKNPTYDKYLRMHKVFVGNSGGKYLENIASRLETSAIPTFLDAAGWAFAESGLVQNKLSSVARIKLIQKAEESWEKALSIQTYVEQTDMSLLKNESQCFRLALNLAYAPLMKGLIVGNVATSIRERAFADTLAISKTSVAVREVARSNGNDDEVRQHIGLEHECNALLATLYMNDPRYIPLPSSSRADSGYYHRDQTHDIAIINQHWGVIRKTIPVEVKGAPTRRDKQRYKALVIRGKMHLSVQGKFSPEFTLNAFAAVYDKYATFEQQQIADHAALTMKDLLRLYQSDSEQKGLRHINSRTRFHNVGVAAIKYTELAI